MHVSAAQAGGVKEIADYVAQLRRVGRGLGVYEFDKFLAQRATTLPQLAVPGAAEEGA